MEFQEIITAVIDGGVTLAVIAYFMYRDNKFMSKLETTLQALVDTVDYLNNYIKREGDDF